MALFIVAALAMTVVGLLLGCVIGLFAKIFRVETDQRIELVTELLPNANCGGCGKAGCADFAKSVVEGENPPGKCPVSSRETISAIARALGIEAGGEFKQVAVVTCSGDHSKMKTEVRYNGVTDCVSASLIAGGPKGCAYGCLGMSSCSRACPFGAIEIRNGLAVVHSDLCVGCGKCVATCPRGLIKLVPADAPYHVFCNSPEKGPAKKKVCDSPCIGCRKCLKAMPEKMTVTGFLAKVNYSAPAPTAEEIAAAACPTGCLRAALPVKKEQEVSEVVNG